MSVEENPTRGPQAAPAVSAVVVNYNAGELLAECVASFRREGVDDVVVVDNGSEDGSVEGLTKADPDVKVVRPGGNLGFGAGANAGARYTRHGLVLVANPDLVLHSGAVAALIGCVGAHDDVAVVGPRLLNADDTIYPSARPFPSISDAVGHAFVGLVSEHNPWTRRYKLPMEELSAAKEVDWVSGACFLARADAFASVGGFDEAYFMYMEDVDLCWRLRRAGWRVLYEPAAVVTHLQGTSTSRHAYRMLFEHHRSMWRFARRTSKGTKTFLLPLVAAGLVFRFILASAKLAADGRRRDAGEVPRDPGRGETGLRRPPTKV